MDQLLAVYLTEGTLYMNDIILIDITNSYLLYIVIDIHILFLFSEGRV